MLNRRKLLAGTAIGAAGFTLPRTVFADGHAQAMKASALIYITPIQTSGAESGCQAEVWFAALDGDMYVVTSLETWRAQAVREGLTSARVWIGDVGPWKGSNGGYKALPRVETMAAYTTDTATQERVLAVMGAKYSREWGMWGPRFRNGLADGSRVMLRYRLL